MRRPCGRCKGFPTLEQTPRQPRTGAWQTVSAARSGKPAAALAALLVAFAAFATDARAGVTVAISSPAAGATLHGNVVWEATPSGGNVSQVNFVVDGHPVWADRGAPYRYNGDSGSLDTRTLSSGAHTLSVVPTMRNGRTAAASIDVTVANFAVSVAQPADGRSEPPGAPHRLPRRRPAALDRSVRAVPVQWIDGKQVVAPTAVSDLWWSMNVYPVFENYRYATGRLPGRTTSTTAASSVARPAQTSRCPTRARVGPGLVVAGDGTAWREPARRATWRSPRHELLPFL